MSDWREFWNGEHSIYVNERHRALHDRLVARDIAAIVAAPTDTVLDYACGEASEALMVARACGRLLLSDAAPTIRQKLERRFGTEASIDILSPDEVRILPEESIDLVVVNSLVQYLSPDELADLCGVFHDKLKPGGRLVVGDVIPPGLSPITDAAALLRFGWEGGFLVASVAGLAKTAVSDYRKLRSELGLTTYDENTMLTLLERAGFDAERRSMNIGHNQARMTFMATKPTASGAAD
jgi:SAM-dependent methyltransferase